MASEHRLIIGRDPSCDVVLNDPYASPRHAALIWVRDPGVVQVMDLGSTNGVWLNRERVWGRRLITFTDTLLVGRTQLDVGLLLLKLAYARGIAEGLRQATEGWERQYQVMITHKASGHVSTTPTYDEERARRGLLAYEADPEYDVLLRRRLVGPWEPAGQPEPAREAGLDERPRKVGCERHPSRWFNASSPTTGVGPCDGDPATCVCGPQIVVQREDETPEGSDR